MIPLFRCSRRGKQIPPILYKFSVKRKSNEITFSFVLAKIVSLGRQAFGANGTKLSNFWKHLSAYLGCAFCSRWRWHVSRHILKPNETHGILTKNELVSYGYVFYKTSDYSEWKFPLKKKKKTAAKMWCPFVTLQIVSFFLFNCITS